MENMTIEEIYMRKQHEVENKEELCSIFAEYGEELIAFAKKLQDLKERMLEVE